MKSRNIVLFLTVIFLWAFNWLAMKIGLRYVSPTAFVLQRFTIGASILLVVVVLLRKELPKDAETLMKFLPLSLIFAGLMAIQAIALVGESTGIGSVVMYTQPLFVCCLAVPLLGEKVTKKRILGTVMGFVGVVVLFASKMHSFALASTLLMSLAAFLWAIQIIYYKKFLNHVDGLNASFLQLAIGVLPLLALSIPGNDFAFPGDPLYILLVLYSSVGGLALGSVLWFFLLRQEDATTLSSFSLLIPPVTLILGWQLLGEMPGIALLIGSTLTLAGVYLTNLGTKTTNSTSIDASRAETMSSCAPKRFEQEWFGPRTKSF